VAFGTELAVAFEAASGALLDTHTVNEELEKAYRLPLLSWLGSATRRIAKPHLEQLSVSGYGGRGTASKQGERKEIKHTSPWRRSVVAEIHCSVVTAEVVVGDGGDGTVSWS